MSRPWAADLLHLWFHVLRPQDWWGSARTDVYCARYAHLLGPLSQQPVERFLGGPQTALAAVLLFDQIPRNLFRDSARAFAYDDLACAICNGALDRGFLHRLQSREERQFLAIPLMHSEHISDHLRSLAVYRQMPRHGFAFARSHAKMIARFGRYPHRNPVLGRKSSAAEERAVAAGFSW